MRRARPVPGGGTGRGRRASRRRLGRGRGVGQGLGRRRLVGGAGGRRRDDHGRPGGVFFSGSLGRAESSGRSPADHTLLRPGGPGRRRPDRLADLRLPGQQDAAQDRARRDGRGPGARGRYRREARPRGRGRPGRLQPVAREALVRRLRPPHPRARQTARHDDRGGRLVHAPGNPQGVRESRPRSPPAGSAPRASRGTRPGP